MADYFYKVGRPGSATTMAAPGYTTGATTITVGSTANWPTDTKVAFAIDRAEIVAGEEVQIAGTYTEWTGQVTGATTIGSMALSSDSPNSDQNYAAGSLTRVYIPVSATRENNLIDGILEHANQDGTLITQAVRDALSLGVGSGTGWEVGSLPDVSTVTANGNRSYDVTFASAVDSILSEGMRLEFTKTVAGNGYMGGAFNGSSHYFTKTSPSGTLGTVTNNITIEAEYQPTSYQEATIVSRSDAAGNNSIILKMTASGTVTYGVQNGGAGNYRLISTYQSLPLNKKTSIAASWTGGTVVIYFDGVSVPVVAAGTAGTAPTTAGTGGDFSIGRKGASASEYAPGYISNVAVFDAVLSAATIKQHASYKLTGSETNCIGAWSLDNTANDQSSAGNNLTATGGVGFTAQSPHGQLGNGVETTKAVGLVMSVDGTDVTVQVPEGCTIPTSGGITSVAYSTQANPYGWVSDKGRWYLTTFHNYSLTQGTPTAGTYYNIDSAQLSVPVGSWILGVAGTIGVAESGGTLISGTVVLSKSSSTADDPLLMAYAGLNAGTGAAGNINLAAPFKFDSDVGVSSTTPYYLNAMTTSLSAPVVNMTLSSTRIKAFPSCL